MPGSMQVYIAYFYPFTYNHRRSRQLYPVLLLPAGLSGSVMPNGSHSPQVPCALTSPWGSVDKFAMYHLSELLEAPV